MLSVAKVASYPAFILHRMWERSPKQIAARLTRPLRRPRPTWSAVTGGPLGGCELLLDSRANPYWKEMLTGNFDQFLYSKLVASTDVQGKTVWDIGAHIGYASLMFAALVGEKGRVIAFEPSVFNLKRMKEHLERNSLLAQRIQIMSVAVSNEEREFEFVVSADVDGGMSSGSHLDASFAPLEESAYDCFRRIRVPGVTLDAALDRGDIPPANILKIDVEGAESFVLEGGLNFIRERRASLKDLPIEPRLSRSPDHRGVLSRPCRGRSFCTQAQLMH
jgi:FkbM family methyltransferase